METQIQQLYELQELEIVLAEGRIVHGEDAEMEKLDRQVAALRDRIEPLALARFDRLSQYGMAVVAVRGGMCLGCNITIPVGDLNRMRTGKAEPVCPHCGRFVKA